MRENKYQSLLIKRIRRNFPGCVILKNDSGFMQGIPDLIILYDNHWAMLEVKAHATAEQQPNQEYYIRKLGAMSFAAFVYPENEEEVMNGLQQAFRARRSSRVS